MGRTLLGWLAAAVSSILVLVDCSPIGPNEAASPADAIEDDTPGPERHIAPGTLDSAIVCNHQQVRFSAGDYRGDLIVDGNHCELFGAGDETVVHGNLEIRGESNTVASMTVVGRARLSGSHGRVERVRFTPAAP